MESVSVSKFKATCLSIIEEVQRTGRTIVVTKRGKPVAHLVAAPVVRSESALGCMLGTGRIVGDVLAPIDVEWDALSE